MSYTAPLKDMLFCMKELADLEAVARLPGFEEAGLDTAQAVLEECARFSQEVLAPLNREGDVNPSSFKDGVVTTTAGFKDAFRQFGSGGWQGLQHPGDFGGQGLPKTIGAACIEMINSANLSFALCPLLTDGAIEALLTAGTREQQERFIPKMISGEWTGTMNLTEPQAGSDLALVRTRAEPLGDGRYKIFGTKIFITYGEHDMAENIVHLVLARVAGAPEGVKGISLFIVPKFLVNADGSLGARNDAWCVSIEHKLGIKASPTAVLQFGDQGGAGLDGPGAIGTLDRRGEPRPRVHVHHDERGALRGRHAGHRGRRTRLPAGGGVRQGAGAVAPGRRLGGRQRDHHPPPRRAPHADDDARLHRGLSCAGARRRGGVRCRAPQRGRRGEASRTRRSTSSWCRW